MDNRESILRLPAEMIAHIMKHCTLNTTFRLAFVSRYIRQIACHPSLKLRQRLLDRAFVEIDRQDNQKAIAILDCLLALFPDAYEAWKERAGCWMDLGNPRRAFQDLLKAEKLCTSPSYASLIKSQQCWAKGEYQEAWVHINKAVELDPTEPRFLHFRGYIQSILSEGPGDIVSQMKELADYNKILNEMEYKRMAVIHNNIGYLKYELQLFDEALEHFAKAVELCPDHAQAYYNRAVVFADMDRFEDTIQQCDIIIKKFPKVSDAWVLRGWAYFNQAKYEEAEHDYRRAIASIKGNIPSVHVLSIYLGIKALLGQLDDALEQLNMFVEKYKRKYEFHSKKCIAHPELGFHYEKRRKDFKNLLCLVLQFRAEFLVIRADFEKAKEDFDHLMTLEQQSETGPLLDKSFLKYFLTSTNIDAESIAPSTRKLIEELYVTCKSPSAFYTYITTQLRSGKTCTYLQTTHDIIYFIGAFAYKIGSIFWDRRPNTSANIIEFMETVSTRASRVEPTRALAYHSPYILAWLFEASVQLREIYEIMETMESLCQALSTSFRDADKMLRAPVLFELVDQYLVSLQWVRTPFMGPL